MPPPFDDADIDPQDTRWESGPYGDGDVMGTYREVDAAKRAEAWALLAGASGIDAISLGEPLFVGYPGWGTREYAQHLWVAGITPADGFEGEVGFHEPRGHNKMVSLEERVQTSYNLGSKVNGLAHAAVGSHAYGGRAVETILSSAGVTELDTQSWGPPLLTRGLLYDVLALKLETAAGDVVIAPNGEPLLRDNYRVSMQDLAACAERQRLPAITPGDAVFVRTGWRQLLRDEPKRYLGHSPGVWLKETRELASHRPALVGTDSWCWGTSDPALAGGRLGSCHQELLVGHGVRIAESMNLEGLAERGASVFVLSHTPLAAAGAVSTSAPATAFVRAGAR